MEFLLVTIHTVYHSDHICNRQRKQKKVILSSLTDNKRLQPKPPNTLCMHYWILELGIKANCIILKDEMKKII